MEHHGYVIHQRAQRQPPDVHASNQHAALLNIPEAREQIRDRRLAASTGADQREKRVAGLRKTDLMQNLGFAIAERHVSEFDLRGAARRGHALRSEIRKLRLLKNLLYTVYALAHDGQPRRIAVVLPDGLEHVEYEQQKPYRHHGAQPRRVLQPQRGEQHGHRAHAVKHLQPPLPHGLMPLKGNVFLAGTRKVVCQLFGTLAQEVIALDGPDAFGEGQHRLRKVLALLAHHRAVAYGFAAHCTADAAYHRDYGKPGQSQPRMDAEQHNHHDGFRKDVIHDVRQHRHAVLLQKYHVRGEYGADFADVSGREVSHRQPP